MRELHTRWTFARQRSVELAALRESGNNLRIDSHDGDWFTDITVHVTPGGGALSGGSVRLRLPTTYPEPGTAVRIVAVHADSCGDAELQRAMKVVGRGAACFFF